MADFYSATVAGFASAVDTGRIYQNSGTLSAPTTSN
jgi:hypothetical protein